MTSPAPSPQAVVVRAQGDLDAVTAPALRRTLEDAARSGVSLVVVDLTDVQFLDSAGVSALVGVHRHLPPGQRLAVANVPARMQRALRVTAVSALFQVHEQGQPWPWPDLVPEGPATRVTGH